ncbi:hypothetical protein BC628DRAFT_1418586 [Trametes gibbosa]|nr:hypothetical protein BC628DRAFT_1418586 [Trametes gibbosa]
MLSSLATLALARLQGIFVAPNILLCLAIIIVLPAATPKELKNSAFHVFDGFSKFYGRPDGWVFVLSFLAPLRTIASYALSCMLKTTLTVDCIVQSIAASRQSFAFARDGRLLFSRFIGYVGTHTRMPVNAVWASELVALLLALLVFAGRTTYTAIFSLGITGKCTAYCIPTLSRFLGGEEWTLGPFTLARLGIRLSPGPAADEMNYMIVVFEGVHWFNDPKSTLGNVSLAKSKDVDGFQEDKQGA